MYRSRLTPAAETSSSWRSWRSSCANADSLPVSHKTTISFSATDVGNTLGYTRLLRAFSDAADAAELRGVTPHTCRHTFASILIDQGATVEFVSDQLGHATTKTTWDIYVHLFRRREHAETARQELNAAFGPMLRAVGQDGETK